MKVKIAIILFIVCYASSCSNQERANEEENQTDIKSLESLANDYYANDNYEEASKAFSKLIAVDSTKGEYYYKRGYSYGQMEQYNKEEKDYLKSIELGYRVADAYNNLAFFYMATHRDSLAVVYLKKYLELNPNDETAQNALDLYTTQDTLQNI